MEINREGVKQLHFNLLEPIKISCGTAREVKLKALKDSHYPTVRSRDGIES